MNSGLLKWFIRLLIYPFIIIHSASDEYASEREIFEGSIWFTLGAFCIVVPILARFLYADLLKVEYLYVVLGSSFFYLFFGIVSFFSCRRSNNNIPWYENGRW